MVYPEIYFGGYYGNRVFIRIQWNGIMKSNGIDHWVLELCPAFKFR